MKATLQSIASIVRCPICRHSLSAGLPVRCTNKQCIGEPGFPDSLGQPVLIDFRTSIFTPDLYSSAGGGALPRERKSSRMGRLLRRLTYGSDLTAAAVARRFAERLWANRARPLLLVIGGGTIGEGLADLYATESVTIIGTDAYASDYTTLVCDGHELPFVDGSFDGVVVQAVLEHVLDPRRVADEIHRVLKPGGLVLADTPFMQQVHEGAYDFTRFTKSGHRWLFRRFDEIESGVMSGPGTALLWSISYFVRGLGAGQRLAALITALFFWVRLLEGLMDPQKSADGASATYFIGRKGSRSLAANEMPGIYDAGTADTGPTT